MRAQTREKVLSTMILAGFISFLLLIASAFVAEAANVVKYGENGPQVVELQENLREVGYTVQIDGKFGPKTLRAVNHWQKANGLVQVRQAGPQTLRTLEIAVRGEQVQIIAPPTFSGSCAEWADELTFFSPGWDVAHMQQIMHRESRCQPGARNPSGASGLLQIMPMWVKHLGHCGVYSTSDLLDPAKNICGAAHIWTTQGINAWSQTR